MRHILRWFAILAAMLPAQLVEAEESGLNLSFAGTSTVISRATLLADPELAIIDVPMDVAYGRAMTFRAVPLRTVLKGIRVPSGEGVQAIAKDGFVSPLPAELLFNAAAGAAVPWLALDTAGGGWPKLPGKDIDAGPYYIVWLNPAASRIRAEQWPYGVVELRGVAPPERRWPQIAVAASVPADDPVRAGQALVVSQCMVCHPLNGAGDAHVGPDLNLPQNPTEYLAPKALRQLIRDPASVRQWSAMQMPAHSPADLSDADIDHIAAYLNYMAARKL